MLLDLWPLQPTTSTQRKGGARRHLGKSTGHDKQIHRFINFRWTFTATVDGTTSARARTEPLPRPALTGGHIHGHAAMRTRRRLHVAPQIAAAARVHPHAARVWPDEEDDLLLLDLL